MPEFGDYYIQNNIPEFTTRMVRAGRVVHQERIVTGKVENQTPIFSDEMELVVFKPFWNVPESIKWKELQPQLARHYSALSKAGLRAAYNGKEVDPGTVDWQTADMRAFHIFQPPGAGNALGQVKFLFPNKHDVYMHDTPHKSLFNNPSRAYSHGCMRVRDPLKFAELLLANDKGWDMARVRSLADAGPENNEIRLSRKVPIHVTYFTAAVDDAGKLRLFSDIYSHEQKVHLGLEGKAHLIVHPKEEKYEPPARGQVRFVQKSGGGSDPFENFMKNLFNF
jgi:murein L,D-transpeptidase YcbB/YkuD